MKEQLGGWESARVGGVWKVGVLVGSVHVWKGQLVPEASEDEQMLLSLCFQDVFVN